MVDHRGHAGIADQDFGEALGGGIADERSAQILDQDAADGRKPCSESSCQLDRVGLADSRLEFIPDEESGPVDLIREDVERDAEPVADEIVDILAIEVVGAVVTGKQGLGQARDDLRQLVARRRTMH
jgi:hypothetical protein